MCARAIVMLASSLLLGLCLADVTNAIWQSPSFPTNSIRIVVTQDTCRVFSTAQNRQVDRLRLCKVAQKTLLGVNGTNDLAVGQVAGMRVESVNYIGSNKVEAVFLIAR